MSTKSRHVVIAVGVVLAGAMLSPAMADLTCPLVSSDTTFSSSGLQTDCSSTITTECTTKTGVTFDSTGAVLKLPQSAGNFTAPPGAAVTKNLYFGDAADFDKDGWEDIIGADDVDTLFIMRNQTILCDGTSCGACPGATCAQKTVTSAQWNQASPIYVRQQKFVTPTTNVKGSPGAAKTPIVAGDFDGDGWPDFFEVSVAYSSGSTAWPTAVRMYLNSQNNYTGVARSETAFSCTTTGTGCATANLFPTFKNPYDPLTSTTPEIAVAIGTEVSAMTTASTTFTITESATPPAVPFDIKLGTEQMTVTARTGASNPRTYTVTRAVQGTTAAIHALAAVTNVNPPGTTSSTPTTSHPGDMGPLSHSGSNIVAVDIDNDHDLDILYGHSSGTCPTGFCTTAGQVFGIAIDIWRNQCNPTAAPSGWDGSSPWPCPSGTKPYFVKDAKPLIPSTGTGGHNTAAFTSASPLFKGGSTTLPTNYTGGNTGDPTFTPSFRYADVNGDHMLDLVIGARTCCATSTDAAYRLRIFKGTVQNAPGYCTGACTHTLDTASPIIMSTTTNGFADSLTALFVYDFSLDGNLDLITGSDNDSSVGGRTRYWKNTGSSTTPFNLTPTTVVSEHTSGSANLTASPPVFPDFDVGIMLDYDHDPQRTKDFVFTDGNTADAFYVFPNRASPGVIAACGSVASGTIEPAADAELVITGSCITPSDTIAANQSITYYLTNESPPNWQLACTRTSASASGQQCCATFSSISGRDVQWKAVMDSNTTDGVGVCTASGSTSPSLGGMTATYKYTPQSQHYRAGVIVNDGVSYVGSFSQPGDRGHMYAINAELNTKYWDFGVKLDAQASRTLYTSDLVTPPTAPTRLDFAAGITPAVVGAATTTEADTVVGWVRGARFGVTASSAAKTKLGGIEMSTPGILAKPFRPNWYSYGTTTDRGVIDAFDAAQATRIPLLMFGSKDGMIHAVYSITSSNSDPRNGTEAWAFVPPYVAQGMTSDYNASTTALNVSSYVDGSPTLVDYRKADGTMATVAVVGTGNGGRTYDALDVTQSVTATSSTTNSVSGPTPLWSALPGGSSAGKALAKAAVARVRISGTEKFLAITGTGIDSADASKGKIVAAWNLETGALMWSFEMQCALTSDITVFETDDVGTYEPGTPNVDGFIDRAVFADACGYVYKVNPAQAVSTGAADPGWIGNVGFGGISIGTSNGVARYALFSTATTTNALGAQSPIAGTIGARVDSTTDIVLFFGTGGLESWDPSLTNEFYAIYAKTGAVRSKVTGSCTAGKCQKFYGGVVITPDSVILQRTYDASVSSTTCDFGSTVLQGFNIDPGTGLTFTNAFADIVAAGGQALAAVAGPLYGDAGALYFATVAGTVVRVGTPRAANAGGDTSTAGFNPGMSTAGDTSATASGLPMILMGWRVVL